MIRPRRQWGAALLAALVMPAAALADHPFILPSSTSLSGDGNSVTFDAAGSDHVFFFDHRPLPFASIRIWKPDATPGTPYNGLQGRFRSIFDLKLDEEGTWKIASEQTMIMGSIKVDGVERRVGGRGGAPGAASHGDRDNGGQHGDRHDAGGAPGAAQGGSPGRGGAPSEGGTPSGSGGEHRPPPIAFEDIPASATDVHLTELLSRAETFVTDGAPTRTVFKPEGKGLEFDPITHPNALAQGETARFRLLIDGKPAPGVKVTVIPGGDRYRDDARAMNLGTDRDGVVEVTWPTAGMFWFGAEAEDNNPAEDKVEARRMTYSATLEVMTP